MCLVAPPMVGCRGKFVFVFLTNFWPPPFVFVFVFQLTNFRRRSFVFVFLLTPNCGDPSFSEFRLFVSPGEYHIWACMQAFSEGKGGLEHNKNKYKIIYWAKTSACGRIARAQTTIRLKMKRLLGQQKLRQDYSGTTSLYFIRKRINKHINTSKTHGNVSNTYTYT